MAIDSVIGSAKMAEDLSIPQLQQAIQSGSIPPYIGIPALQQKVAMQQRMQNAAAQAQQGQPTVADQVMAQAQGVEQLPSNLPQQYAGGGIVAFAEGGYPDSEEFSMEEDDEFEKALDAIARQMQEMRAMTSESIEPSQVEKFPRSITFPGFTSTEIKKGVSVKEGDQPARTIEERQQRVSKPAGLEELLELVKQKESGDRRFDKSGNVLTSPKGAMGEMQVMPATARDPGFGIRPAREGDLDDLARVGREYFTKMLEKYGDPKLAAIAYNMGPGATDKWLMAGADPARLPDETRKYAQGFANGGQVKRFQYGGISGTTPYSLADLGLDDLARMARMGEPGAAEELMRRRLATPAQQAFDISDDSLKMRDAAARRLRMEQARGAFSGAPSATPSVAPSAPAAPVDERSLLRRGAEAAGRGAGTFFGDLMRSGSLARGLGIGALLTPSTTNANEKEELERYRQMPPTITTTEKLAPMEPHPNAFELPLPARPAKPAAPAPKPMFPVSEAGAGRGIQGGPTAEQINAYARDAEIGASQDFEDLERGLGMTEMARRAQEESKKAPEAAADPYMQRLRDRIERGYAKLERDAESDKYLALIAAGLNIMGGTSPYAMANIGKGSLAGLDMLSKSQASRAAQERALMNAELYAERYSQADALRKAQLEGTQAYRESESQRKREASEAAMQQKREALELRQQQMYGNQLKEIERMAQTAALAREKGAILPEQKEAIGAKALEDLRSDPGYRRLYKLVHGFDPMPAQSGNTISWDQLGK